LFFVFFSFGRVGAAVTGSGCDGGPGSSGLGAAPTARETGDGRGPFCCGDGRSPRASSARRTALHRGIQRRHPLTTGPPVPADVVRSVVVQRPRRARGPTRSPRSGRAVGSGSAATSDLDCSPRSCLANARKYH
jgi:hypothetical protein